MEPAFTDFLLRSWESFRNSLGTTNLGFIAPLIASVLSIVLTLIFVVREQGIAGLKLHWKQDARVGLLVLLIVTVLVYGVIFLYDGILRTIYNEEQTAARLAQQNRELSEQLERNVTVSTPATRSSPTPSTCFNHSQSIATRLVERSAKSR